LNKKGEPARPHRREYQNTESGKCYSIVDFAIRWIDGRFVHMENIEDISELKRKERELKIKTDALNIAASTDSLTGINNRQSGGLLLEEGYKRVLRTRRKSTLCFLDLDGLKKVNDTYGHSEGDSMIVSFVAIVKEVIRSVDTFCRWGGDEFILRLEECDIVQAETSVLGRMYEIVAGFNRSNTSLSGGLKNYKLSFSYGLEEICPPSISTLDEIIASADRKMYDNKREKRTR
jgi:diguanylate cyclase (GGDEF)-like protein